MQLAALLQKTDVNDMPSGVDLIHLGTYFWKNKNRKGGATVELTVAAAKGEKL